jgi:uncharacterized protein YjiS (DUF1127 family)
MAFDHNHRTHAINLREEVGRKGATIYMPAMPPMGLSRAISQWLRGRRRARRSEPLKKLDNRLGDDLGVSPIREPRLNERQLTSIYAQPLGTVRIRQPGGAPAERHALRHQVRDTRQ